MTWRTAVGAMAVLLPDIHRTYAVDPRVPWTFTLRYGRIRADCTPEDLTDDLVVHTNGHTEPTLGR
ncbi:hypothetical protein GCM10010442_27650 [Kitasatospora kifunensis]